MKAIRISRLGGPEVMEYVDYALPPPGPGEVRVRNAVIGLNFGESYFRSGLYGVPRLPSGMGSEAVGVVEALGQGVVGFSLGDRVAYAEGVLGAYAEAANVPADRLVRPPEGLPDEMVAAALSKGLTAQMLIRQTFRVEKGQTILLHAAAGGVGVILAQWARSLGARVIGATSSAEKAAFARQHGCSEVVDVTRPGWVEAVMALTHGAGVPVVFDSNGRDTFLGSLDCLAPLGTMVSYGNASGPAPAIEPLELMRRGSLRLTRPYLGHYLQAGEGLAAMADELFEVLAAGKIRLPINQRFRLSQALEAHERMGARGTTGLSVMIP